MYQRIAVDLDDHVLLIGINRPDKRNAFDLAALEQLSAAYQRLGEDAQARVGVLYAHGAHFSAGLDLGEVGPVVAERGPEALKGSGRYDQLEVGRGILPFGGATFRAPAQLGWGNAMRFLLTAEEFGADQALRIGLVQEVVSAGRQLDRAVAIARAVAAQAPLGVQGTLANARAWRADAERAAVAHLRELLPVVLGSEDAAEGLRSFIERRAGRFTGQ